MLLQAFIFLLAGFAAKISALMTNETSDRPLVHFTPNKGWMNDPNGLWYDAKEGKWHLYFQYNPNDTVWGLPLFWGHATSNDLTHWQDEPVAIAPKRNDSGAYSGSMVIDHNNTSGFSMILLIQDKDAWQSGLIILQKVKNNTLAIPLMVVLGYQYECPGLIEVPTEQDPSKSHWVMFISINPGAPAGGSFNQYFVGSFNGTHFEAFDNQSRVVDFGKDYYALQTFFNTDPTYGSALGIAWASNWEYSAFVPTNPWRSSMSLVRKFSLNTEYQANPETELINLKAEPILNISNAGPWLHFASNSTLTKANSFSVDLSNSTGTLEFELVYAVNTTQSVSKSVFSDLSLWFKGLEDPEEYLRMGFEASASSFFLDRGNSKVKFVKENPYFTNRMSVNNQPFKSENDLSYYKVYGLLDQNILNCTSTMEMWFLQIPTS
ncbi:Invertase 4 [Saccharomyces pastorianus]|uniref:beta-fructofuranosidase n=1 Tax=Saccharomyces pastorianus TaxID=27292 RepID=A0A6C1DMI6_SACPS|nr:Invertase 4 [Saccharomyces pastorianus]